MMPIPQVTPADLARLRTRFAAVSELVAPKLAEVNELLPRVWAEQVMPEIAAGMEAVNAEAGEMFRRLGEGVNAALDSVKFDPAAILPAVDQL